MHLLDRPSVDPALHRDPGTAATSTEENLGEKCDTNRAGMGRGVTYPLQKGSLVNEGLEARGTCTRPLTPHCCCGVGMGVVVN